MRTTAPLLGLVLLASACGSMQPTTQVRDDVYDIPDRTPVAAVAPLEEPPPTFVEDYFDPADSGMYNVSPSDGGYNDITYNDPQWYNYDRFGFNVGMSTWGPSGGIGMNYGSPGFYDPYWNNSYMSGFGAWGNPYYGPGWNMWGSMSWGNPYGGFPPYGYPYGGYYPYGGIYPFYPPGGVGCVGGWGNNSVVSHRPSWTGGSGAGTGSTVRPTPNRYRPNSLTSPQAAMGNELRRPTQSTAPANRNPQSQPMRNTGGRRGGGEIERRSPSGGSRGFGTPGGGSSPSPGGGGSRPSTGGRR